MFKLTCEPLALIAAFVLAVMLTESLELNPVLMLGAVAGSIYLALLARRGLRRPALAERVGGVRA
jgi:hypothetical protein